MSAKSRLAQNGMRFGTLGAAASLCIAFPLVDGYDDPTAHTAAGRIGFYADRSANNEKIGVVVKGAEIISVGYFSGATRVTLPGTNDATSTSSGELVVGGGVGIGKNLRVGGAASVFSSSADSVTDAVLQVTDTFTGSITDGPGAFGVLGSGNYRTVYIKNLAVTGATVMAIAGPLSVNKDTGKAFQFLADAETTGRMQFFTNGAFGVGPGPGSRDVFLLRAGTGVFGIANFNGNSTNWDMDHASTAAGHLRIKGTVQLGAVSTLTPAAGMIQWTGSAFQGHNGTAWAPLGGGTPGGADTQVQFNDAGAFAGDTAFAFNKTTKVLGARYIQFDPNPAAPTDTAGLVYWNTDDSTLNVVTGVGGAVIQVGHESVFRAANQTLSAISDGTPVYITGAQGQRPTIAPADADQPTADRTIGLTTTAFGALNNSEGLVTLHGLVRGINTNAWNEGDTLYLSTTAGVLTNTPPAKPNHIVRVGYVVNKGVNGSVYVDVNRGQMLSELHDATITTPSAGHVLRYDGTLWVNSTLATAFGTQAANTVYAGPATGAAATPAFRALVSADIPALAYDATGTAAGLMSAHTGASDPHPQYLTQAEGDAAYASLAGAYANPSWITSLAYSKLTGAPTTWAWSSITSTPTTLGGYGITDGLTAATAASTYLPLAGGTMTGLLRVNLSGGTLPATPTDAVAWFTNGGTGTSSRVVIGTYNGGSPAGHSVLMGRTARGTIAAPAAIQNGDEVLSMEGFGYGATGFSASARAEINFFAAEDWTDTAQGMRVGIYTTAPGTLTTSEKVRVWGDGGVTIGTSFSASMGVGSLDVRSTTNATSATSTSAFRVAGGVAVAQDLWVGGKVGGLVEFFDGYIEAPTNKTYTLRSKANVACTLSQIRGIKTSSGTCTVALQINGVNVTGASAVAVTSTAQDVTLTAANNVAAGDRITVVVTSASGAVDLEFTLASTRT